jgi:hypothetical protein
MNLTKFKSERLHPRLHLFCNQQLADITSGYGTKKAVTPKCENIPPQKTILSQYIISQYSHERAPSPTYIFNLGVISVTSIYSLINSISYRLHSWCNFGVTSVTTSIMRHLAICPLGAKNDSN